MIDYSDRLLAHGNCEHKTKLLPPHSAQIVGIKDTEACKGRTRMAKWRSAWALSRRTRDTPSGTAAAADAVMIGLCNHTFKLDLEYVPTCCGSSAMRSAGCLASFRARSTSFSASV